MNEAAILIAATIFLCAVIVWIDIRADRRERRYWAELESRIRPGPLEGVDPPSVVHEAAATGAPWLRRIPKEKPIFLNDAHEASLEARGEGGRDR